MSAECLVTMADFARHWEYRKEVTIVAAPYAGPERRIAATDRRAPGHERRDAACRGRRFRSGDRRRPR